MLDSITVAGQTLSPDAKKDLVTAAGANATMQTASYGLLVSNPNWPNDGSCTLMFSPKTGGAPSTSCGTVVSAQGNMLSANQAAFRDGTTAGAWIGALNSTVTAVQNIPASPSTYVMAATSTARSYDFWYPQATTILPVTADTPYTFTMASRAATVPRRVAMRAVWWTGAGGTGTYTETEVPAVTDTTTGWTTSTGTMTSPPGTVSMTLRIYVTDATRAVGETHYFTNIGVWPGTGGQWALPGQPIYK